ncbi:MAG: DUF2752 domain-containing protein [Clostridia bacterium]|nr:DUF2752 domain-containing protein [Clostridia bacterium]
MDNPKTRLKRLFLVATVVLLIGLVYYGWIKITGLAIPCIIHTLTGIFCTGCGITRMFVALLGANFLLAARSNLLAFILIIPITLFAANRGVKYVKHGYTEFSKWEKTCVVIFIVLATLFTLLRNIPYFSFLRPI